MESYQENPKFELSFSKKAIRNNSLWVMFYSILTAIIFIYAGVKSAAGWYCFIWASICLITSVYCIFYAKRLPKDSYFEITSDNILKCVYKGRDKVEYPIREIKNIEEATLKEAEKRYATFPVVLNSRGYELYPSDGVLITFNRAWIKSIFPVYFNPADSSAFISAIKQRIETTDRTD